MVRLVRHCLLMRSVMRHGDQIRQVACAVNAECEYPFGQGRRAHSLGEQPQFFRKYRLKWERFENPHRYYVDLSQRLWTMKNDLIEEHMDRV